MLSLLQCLLAYKKCLKFALIKMMIITVAKGAAAAITITTTTTKIITIIIMIITKTKTTTSQALFISVMTQQPTIRPFNMVLNV